MVCDTRWDQCSPYYIYCDGVWIISGWKAGFMMAQMGAVTACILTALDNPVPVLRIFIWAVLLQPF